MKVCTDACVFGAFIKADGAQRILDIGTGTGLIALMIAQKSTGTIDAVEIDEGAAGQARENFAGSRFADRLRVFAGSAQDYARTFASLPYDLVCCNPPFFDKCLPSENAGRRIARHTDTLSFADLAAVIAKLLSEDGFFYVHVPINFEAAIRKELRQRGLEICERVTSRHSLKKPENLVMLRGKRGPTVQIDDALVFRNDDDSDYSPRVRAMLQPYYLSIT